MRFHIHTDRSGGFRFTLKRYINDQVILLSESYTSKQGSINGVDSVKLNSIREGAYERIKSRNGKFYFNLKSTNGAIIGTSPMHLTTYSVDFVIKDVKNHANRAHVVFE